MSRISELLKSDDPRFHHIDAATKRLFMAMSAEINELENGVVILEEKVAKLEGPVPRETPASFAVASAARPQNQGDAAQAAIDADSPAGQHNE